MRLKISLGPNKAIPLVHVERVRSMRAMLQTLVDASKGGNWVHSAMANDFVRGLQALEELEKLEGAEGRGGYEDEYEEGGYEGSAYGGSSFLGRSYGRGSRSSSSNAVTDALLMAQHSLALLVVHYSNSLQQELSSCQERLAQAEAALSQVQTDKSELLARYAAQGTQLSELMAMESLLSNALANSQAMVASLTGTGTPRSIGEGGTPLKTIGGYIPASLPATPLLSPTPLLAHNTAAQFDAAADAHTSPAPSLSPTLLPACSTAAQIGAAAGAHASPTRTHSSSPLPRLGASSGVDQGSSRLSSPCLRSAPSSIGDMHATSFHHHQQHHQHHHDQQQQQQQQQQQHSGSCSPPQQRALATFGATTTSLSSGDTLSPQPQQPSGGNYEIQSCSPSRGASVAEHAQAASVAEQTNAADTAGAAGIHERKDQQQHQHQQQEQEKQVSSPKPPPSSPASAAPRAAAEAVAAAPASVLRPLGLFSLPAEKAADSILARAAKGVAPSPQQASSLTAAALRSAAQQGNSRAGRRGLDPGISCVSGQELRLLRLLLGIVQLDCCIGQVLHGSWGIICAAWSMAWNTSQLVAGAVWPWTLLRRFL
eukprot:CAMPEP_0202373212 /NCGR_PEP_ID=MMETSP1127-20130417/4266_1 /ASSEMBLY_ACC=CAM_ASM_000462 /TAXON_ID=3047 /ORGANISM="Dunaliella tertiolecta, Strain CCMP1320" /LENGTH=596 /DNA_ID=CAMNT_0048970011 /DNA_START=96 /DNA_END=1886 /DNA_ORIENTATION=+